MSDDFHVGKATLIPDWATQRIGDEADFDTMEFTVEFYPTSLTYTPDGFRWFVEQQLDTLRRVALAAYYEQWSGRP